MAKLLSNPKLLTVAIVLGILFIVGLAGGALGNEFGGGFLTAPIAHIQLAAEDVTSELVGGFAITNTMLATWITILVLAGFAFFSTRRMSLVPRGLQNLAEAIIEGFLNLAQSVAGPENGRRFFPLAMTIFLFIVMANWLGILPGYGTIGRIETAEHIIAEAKYEAKENDEVLDLEDINLTTFEGGAVALVPFGSEEITAAEYQADPEQGGRKSGRLVPFLRSANTDLNTTLAIALVAMFMIQFWGIRSLGLSHYMGKFINFRAGPIGFFVGVLESISEVARLISFTFRLFGNIFAGEILLIAMAFLIPLVGIIPFLGLELFVGFIQAFIFAMLTLVFATMATVGHESSEH